MRDSSRNHTFHFMAPAREDIVGHLMRFIDFDVLGHTLRDGQPGRRGGFAHVVVLRRAEVGAQADGELIGAPVMRCFGFGADFMRGTVDFEGANDLSGVEQGVNHD